MKLRLLAATLAALTLTAGAALAQDTTSDKGKLSYYFGYETGSNLAALAARGEQVDINTVLKGVQDAYAKKQPSVSVDQLRPTVEAFQKREQARGDEAKAKYQKLAADNTTKSAAFMAQNKAKAGVKSLPAGAQYRVIEAGTGAKPTMASTVQLQIAGPFVWGQRPAQMPPQQQSSMKISGISMVPMREALLQMPTGSKWEITIPGDKVGADPRTGMEPNAVIVYEVKLVSAK